MHLSPHSSNLPIVPGMYECSLGSDAWTYQLS